MLTAIALVAILTISVFAILPFANAHTPPMTVPTYAYLSVAPNPAGVGQQVFVNFWLNLPPPTAAGAYGDRWHGLTVAVTKPDGTTQTLGPYSSDAVGGWYATYTPTTIGTYTFQFKFPGQTLTGENPNPVTGTATASAVNDTYTASTSPVVSVIVQQQQIQDVPANPLPTGYWQRPIQSVNSPWYQISGNWLGLAASTFAATGQYNASGNFNPYTTAPNTAHILWTKPEAFGGMIGGEFGGSQTGNYYSTSQYEPKFAPIIMNGILYYTQYPGSSTYPAGWVAMDIRTGQVVWTKQTNEILRCGQTFNYISPNQYGALAYLWSIPNSATGYAYSGPLYYSVWDAMTGNPILNITNALPMTLVEADDGSLIGYFVNSTSRTLNKWNSTECILYPNGHITENWMWRPASAGKEINFTRGLMWSVPLTTTMPGTGAAISPNLGISKVTGDVILMLSTPNTGAVSTFFQPGWQIEAAYNAKTGQLLWGPLNRTETAWTRIYMGPAAYGVYTEYVGETMTWTGYSLTTGAKLWGPTEPRANAWSYYGCQMIPAYGNLYAWDFGGYVNCYDMQTGTLKWSWNTGSSGYETPYGVWPLWTFTAGTVADGKVFVPVGHMYSPPLFHGAKQLALNATTGELVWGIQSFDVTSGPAIADGVMVTLNAYDNQIYAYSKGQSATTISASPITIANGGATTIQGTVTDQSPGQTSLGIPAAGTPAISDESMTSWMEYLYMQQPKPSNATGVPVRLTAIDPNGNTQDIGTVTSDTSGNYAIMWTPPVPGLYKITATFEGSNSYYSSFAEVAIGVSAAATPAPATPTSTPVSPPTSTPVATASPSPAPQPEAGPSTDMYIIAAAAVVIIVVIAAAAVFLRKRK